MPLLRSIRAFLIIVPLVVLVGPPITIAGLLHLPRSVLEPMMRFFARTILFAIGARVHEVRWRVPREQLPEQLVLVANHESHLDTQLVFSQLGRSIRFVGKQSLFYIPIFGWALWATGNVPVSRDNTKKDIGRLSDSRARRRDRDIMFFPEGTRSVDGNLRPFKKGAFAFALVHRRSILPIGIAGTRDCLPSHSLTPTPGSVAMVVGEPIDISELTYDDRDTLRDRAREAVEDLRREAKELLSSGSHADS